MFTLILVLSIVGSILFYNQFKKYKPSKEDEFTERDLFGTLMGISITIAVLSICICCTLLFVVSTESVIDEKISMYEKENSNIENDLNNIVENYMKYESETYKDLKMDENSMILISLYPELKTDKLVSNQMQIYVNNNEKIKELKTDKINISKKKWLLIYIY